MLNSSERNRYGQRFRKDLMKTQDGAWLGSYDSPEKCMHNRYLHEECPDCDKNAKESDRKESIGRIADLISLSYHITIQTAKDIAEEVVGALERREYAIVLEYLTDIKEKFNE